VLRGNHLTHQLLRLNCTATGGKKMVHPRRRPGGFAHRKETRQEKFTPERKEGEKKVTGGTGSEINSCADQHPEEGAVKRTLGNEQNLGGREGC